MSAVWCDEPEGGGSKSHFSNLLRRILRGAQVVRGSGERMALISWRSLGPMWLAIAVAIALAAEPCHAQSAATSSFNHFTTGFPLTGAHSSVDCGSCHTNGRFKGTPTQCFACHNGVNAQGKSQAHPKTTNFCEGCHQTSVWRNLPFIDHVQATAPCADCHNGTIALGKPANHVVTAAPCDGCHKSTANFGGATTFNHAGIVTGCASCHDGATALGKPANHVPTVAPCETCHKSTVTWLGAVFTHAATDVNCSSCHNGSGAAGLTSPPHIPVTGVQCSNCHTNTAPSFVTYTMNHSAVSASRCDSCHNGSYTGEGTKGALGTASLPGHVATGGKDCITCHASAATGFTSWSGGVFTHAATDTNCSSCHNGTTATGHTTPPHIPVTGVQCSNCHTNTAPSFTTYTMNHSAVSASRCDSCHNGSYTGEGTKGAVGTASFPNHVATNGKDCITCHASAATGFTSWTGGVFTHAATDTNCSSCHNGTTAAGLTTPPHIPVTGVQCSNCHTNTAPSFVTYTMNHSAVSASRCDSCHNGSYTGEGTKGALGTASLPGHVATGGKDCITCHASAATGFTSWSGGVFTHAATDTNCSSCHNGTTATGHTTPPHIPVTGIQCSNCHTNIGAELCNVHDESLGGERQPLRLLSQRLLHGRGDQGRPRHRLSAGARRDQRQGLHHLPCRRRHRLYQLGGRRVHPCSHRHQLFELPQRHYRDRPDHTAAHSGERGSVQQLPHQYGAELHKLHNESLGGERQPLRLLSQRFLHRSGHQGRARDGFVRRSRSNQWYGLRHLPCQRGHRLHQLDRRQIYSCGHRHQLLELSQWHHGDRAYHAAAHPGDGRSVQQLPHQYRAELCDLHDEPLGGEREPLRLLPQWLVHRRGDQGCARDWILPWSRRHQRQGLHHLPCQRRHQASPAGLGVCSRTQPPTPIARAVTMALRQPGLPRRRTSR